MPTNLKIDYLEFPAEDFVAVQAFYEQAFEWKFTPYGSDYLAFTDGKMDGGFYRSPLQSSPAAGAVLVVFYAADLEATYRRVVSAGAKIVQEIFAFPGGRRFQFADPHGNELAVWSER
ncbi:VOC family protein [Aureliella helgolandensis]|uniref:Glyoxalase-like domain protein n=1 Tax=Aureliella helgolandensis TaxID=2527968 RepID=A0A518G366_9BACT|nr:VOC family protein [Aureliella helgolandensis]QDV23015.1 Glyoxalase-like domain protein [Aureliella helgolandensis]